LKAETIMAKRKRVEIATTGQTGQDKPRKAVKSAAVTSELPENDPGAVTIQVVTGSYQSVLHGFTVTLPAEPPSNKKSPKEDAPSTLRFADTFLFQAHTSAIRTLALSPPTNTDSSQPQTAILATGGSDERINLYSISMAPPIVSERFPSVSTLAGNKILENPKNREIGTLLHHSSSITTLYFPSKSKLLSAAEDNTISVTRIRDWNVVSTVKAPQPKAQGRPSGDTAPAGSVPCGINDFAVHPSMKLMISVGRGEKCMRLWNLMTGKKAGVLNFDRELLQSVKENKRSTGEGRGIIWDKAGEEFAIAFEWGVAVFGIVGFTSSHISTESPLTLRTGLNAQMQSHSIPDNQSAESAICRF
jgi:protein MAK11